MEARKNILLFRNLQQVEEHNEMYYLWHRLFLQLDNRQSYEFISVQQSSLVQPNSLFFSFSFLVGKMLLLMHGGEVVMAQLMDVIHPNQLHLILCIYIYVCMYTHYISYRIFRIAFISLHESNLCYAFTFCFLYVQPTLAANGC